MTYPNPDEADQVLREVGDPNGTIQPILAVLYRLYQDKLAIDTRLPGLYVRRAAIDQRLAEEQPSTDLVLDTEAIEDKQSQRFTHLEEMRAAADAEILRIQTIASANRAPAAGALSTIEPARPPTPCGPDASDRRYTGDPYRRRLQ